MNEKLEKLLEQFDKNEENQKLLNLYESKNYREVIAEIKKTNEKVGGKELVLHLPCITGNYKEMNKKILIIGQEVDGWRKIKDNPKDAMLDTLDISIKPPKHKPKHPRPFNAFSRKFCETVNKECKSKFPISWASANIRKFSYNKVSPKSRTPKIPLNDEVQNLIDTKFNILRDEIKIINPDIVLFLTGPNYDDYIKVQLNGVKFHKLENSDYEKRQFARVEHEVLPKKSFRIYHPNAFRQGSVIKMFGRGHLYKEFLKRLVEECKK